MDCTTRRGYRQHHELLQLELGQWAHQSQLSLTPKHQRIVHTLDWLDLPGLLGYAGKRAGPPERSRMALAQAFVAKAVLRLGQTKQLRERLVADAALRRLLGFECRHKVPSEATFSSAFGKFARMGLPERLHEALIRTHLGNTFIGHIARDSTAIHARERAVFTLSWPKSQNGEVADPKERLPVRRAAASPHSCCSRPKRRRPHFPGRATRVKSEMPTATSMPGWSTNCIWTCGLLWRADHRSTDLGERSRQPDQRASGGLERQARDESVHPDGFGL